MFVTTNGDFPDLGSLMSDYLKRELSYETDSLNAIMGIFRTFGHHFWGIFFLASSADALMKRPRLAGMPGVTTSGHGFLMVLLWMPGAKADMPAATRRQDYPSWSWADWRDLGGVFSPSLRGLENELDIFVSVTDDKKRSLTIQQYAQEFDQGVNMYRFEPCLYITGWVAFVRVRLTKDLCLQRILNGVLSVDVFDKSHEHEISSGTIMLQSLLDGGFLDMDSIFEYERPSLLFIQTERRGSFREYVAEGPILKPVESDTYERVGVFRDYFGKFDLVTEGLAPTLSMMNKKKSFVLRPHDPTEPDWKLECERCTFRLV
jgi:hypothetical protein